MLNFSSTLAAVMSVMAISHLARGVPFKQRQSDPPFTVSEAELAAAVQCPTGNTDPKTVLLVPGTGEATELFYESNFGKLLPANGFPVCNLVIPSLSLGDAQVTSEFVVYGINSLAKSTGNPIRVLSHSQGGLNVQWALTFFPSTRANVQSFVALAPDYRGTAEGPLVTTLQKALTGKSMASVFQQDVGSNFLAALASHNGLNALVPTSNIFTRTDDIVQPENGPDTTSLLASGSANTVNVPVQSICADRTDDHFTLVTDTLTQFLALQAFSGSNGLADPSAISAAEQAQICANALPQFTSVNSAISFGESILIAAITTGLTGTPGSMVSEEPALQPYAQ